MESVDNADEPRVEHRAQPHAYLEGLSREYDREVRTGVVLNSMRLQWQHLFIKLKTIKFSRHIVSASAAAGLSRTFCIKIIS